MQTETKHLILFSPDMVNVKSVVDYLQRNRSFLEEFEPNRPDEFFTPAYQSMQLKQQEMEWKDAQNCRLYICPKENPEILIGHVALNGIIMGAFCSCYLGYQLDKDYINHGYMTEAVREAVNYAFCTLQLHRIEANIMPRNLPSIKVVENCGFVREGISKKYMKINGRWEDHVHYVILNGAME